ncbi:hypothetical protein BOTBODRAFT_169766 [Botryobasidium botryosum FD-172 SS1]|uniref:Uncharacterized protein n=1 Tax=Botryobasidium botryosum (strain FD-172 SS1) TaxID=930990 RepID=A0A067MZR3_BOTB1|nr:hypothetical protein BOTBODRAFT_169766 [Botryobasidium botryosum FD-172 SS1]
MIDRPPSYLSSRAADIVLSDVRAIRIKPDALRAMNIFLDELLWLILSSARSLLTEHLKSGLLKVLPTALGKNTLLEAEMELRNYWERTHGSPLERKDDITENDFLLQPVFELLRQKCEAYSTLGDVQEDPELEARLQERIFQHGPTALNITLVSPAALYMTAVLEHIAEHVLNNVARVVSRDSSRTSAHVQDLYIALCEDSSVYPMFRTMKVQEHIEAQSGSSRRSRPSARSRSGTKSSSRPSTMSALTNPGTPTFSSPQRPATATSSRPGSRSKDSRIGTPTAQLKPASDRSKNPNVSKAGILPSDLDQNANGKSHRSNGLRRGNSVTSDPSRRAIISLHAVDSSRSTVSSNEKLANDEAGAEFDQLMKSASTMKVSLTPDRLKTFEVFNKEKRTGSPVVSQVTKATHPATNNPSRVRSPSSPRRRSAAIDDHLSFPSAGGSRGRTNSLAVPTPKRSIGSLHTAANWLRPSSRGRVGTDPHHPPPGMSEPAQPTSPPAGRKQSLTFSPERSLSPSLSSRPSMALSSPTQPYPPPMRTRTRGMNIESIDIDELLDEKNLSLRSLSPKEPYRTSSNTRELIEFLATSPPERPVTAVMTSPPLKSKSSGRFRIMMAKLTRHNKSKDTFKSEDMSSSASDSVRNFPRDKTTPASTIPRTVSSLTGRYTVRSGPSTSDFSPPSSPPLGPSSPPPSFRRNMSGRSEPRARPITMVVSSSPRVVEEEEIVQKPQTSEGLPAQDEPEKTFVRTPTPAFMPIVERAPPQIIEPSEETPPVEEDIVVPVPEPVAEAEAEAEPEPEPKPDAEPEILPSSAYDGVEPMSPISPSVPASPSSGPSEAETPPPPTPPFDRDIALRFRHKLSQASTVEECRLLTDVFFAQCGLQLIPIMDSPLFASASSFEAAHQHETSLIELLLGDSDPLALSA